MKAKIILSFIAAIAAFTIATGQPMIPVSNISPVPANTLIGGPATGVSGRARTILAGDGITIANGTINATGGGGGGAPTNATYITQTPNGTLTNEQALSVLSTGIVIVTTGTGVLTSLVPGTSGNIVTSNGTAWISAAPVATGNVTAAGTLTSGDIVIGQGAKTTATSATINVVGTNATVNGNLTITGGTTFNNLTTSNLTVTGNITATGVGNGTLLIGNTTGTKFDVASLTAGNGITITPGAGSITINATASGTTLAMTATLGSDDTYTGSTLAGLNAGATIAQWEAVYVGGSSTYLLADANGSGTYPARGLAVAGYSSSDPAVILREGPVRNDAWSWTPGGTIYISATPGGLTQTAPSTSGDKVQQVGFALTADIAYFNFASGEYLTVE